jgi:hypothetical protein
MSIELTADQLRAATASPVRITDAESQREYVLVSVEIYKRLRPPFDDDDVRGLEPLLADLAPEDWEDAHNYEEKP